MKPIKVTVYIPSYNYGKFLAKSISSVLRQTFTDWELIVINDGSPDNTAEVLKEFEHCHKIKIVHQQNKGLTVSNNIALRLAQGKYVMRLDADDYLDENALLVMSAILDKRPAIGLVYPDYYLIDAHDHIIEIIRRKKIGEEVTILDLPAHGACTMIRKSCLLELGGYNETLTCQDGYDLWLRFVEKYDVYNVNVPLFYYRRHGNNLTENTKKILSTRGKIKRDFVAKKFGKVPKVLAIIPARGNYSATYDSALSTLHKKPLIAYTLEEAKKCRLLDKIIVTSEDQNVLTYAKKFKGIEVIRRSQELARPNTSIMATIHYVLKKLREDSGYDPAMVAILYINAPLRTKEHIEKAIDTMLIFNTDSVISVTENLSTHYRHGKTGMEQICTNQGTLRLEREALYEANGAVYVSKRSAITEKKFLGNTIGHIIMTKEESVQIDSQYERWLAERIIAHRKQKQ